MTKLNNDARAVLRDAGVSQAAWARANFSPDGTWCGDKCGCPDDRCMDGFHHFPDDECGCLRVLLAEYLAGRGTFAEYPKVSAERAATFRAALELVREGLDIPHAKTLGDDAKRTEILHRRLIGVLIMVRSVLDGQQADAGWSLTYTREQLAKAPAVGYHPTSAPIAFGMNEACSVDGCGHRKGSHREHAEPEGPRTGCVFLGCPCTAYAADAETPGGDS